LVVYYFFVPPTYQLNKIQHVLHSRLEASLVWGISPF
jgi:hypothetical protein